MVRLKAKHFIHSYSVFTFQFHNGSIKRKANIIRRRKRSGFQFHNGSIKSYSETIYLYVSQSFNSTMVRLKVHDSDTYQDDTLEFQFHNGSIKSIDIDTAIDKELGFNSTMVRLKVGFTHQTNTNQSRFNSTMVRLKEERQIMSTWKKIRFNSTMVRLKGCGDASVIS